MRSQAHTYVPSPLWALAKGDNTDSTIGRVSRKCWAGYKKDPMEIADVRDVSFVKSPYIKNMKSLCWGYHKCNQGFEKDGFGLCSVICDTPPATQNCVPQVR